MRDVSRDLLKFWDNISLTVQDRELQWNTNRKLYVTYLMAPLSMLLNDLEGHFCCLKPF